MATINRDLKKKPTLFRRISSLQKCCKTITNNNFYIPTLHPSLLNILLLLLSPSLSLTLSLSLYLPSLTPPLPPSRWGFLFTNYSELLFFLIYLASKLQISFLVIPKYSMCVCLKNRHSFISPQYNERI